MRSAWRNLSGGRVPPSPTSGTKVFHSGRLGLDPRGTRHASCCQTLDRVLVPDPAVSAFCADGRECSNAGGRAAPAARLRKYGIQVAPTVPGPALPAD